MFPFFTRSLPVITMVVSVPTSHNNRRRRLRQQTRLHGLKPLHNPTPSPQESNPDNSITSAHHAAISLPFPFPSSPYCFGGSLTGFFVPGCQGGKAMERWKRGVRLGDDHQARRHVHTLPERGGISPWPSQEGDRCRTTGGEMCVATKDTRVFPPSQHAPTQLTHHIFMW